jgi:hypothetical protein
MNRSETLLAYAKRYIELGFAIHPCCPVDHHCTSPGKVPYDPYEQVHKAEWTNHGIPTEKEVQEWIDQDSSINLGFLCGSPSRTICIDIDSGEGWALYFELAGGIEQPTWKYRTGRGERILYAMPPDMKSFASLNISDGTGARLEILGDGKQTVAPPSDHPNGKRYEWFPDRTPQAIDIALAPEWLLSLRPTGSADADIDWSEEVPEGILEGERNVGLARLAGHLLAPQSLPPKEVLFWLRLYNKHLVKPPISDRELMSIVKSIAKREARATGMRSPEEAAEIKRIMREHNLNWSDAESVWKGMC